MAVRAMARRDTYPSKRISTACDSGGPAGNSLESPAEAAMHRQPAGSSRRVGHAMKPVSRDTNGEPETMHHPVPQASVTGRAGLFRLHWAEKRTSTVAALEKRGGRGCGGKESERSGSGNGRTHYFTQTDLDRLDFGRGEGNSPVESPAETAMHRQPAGSSRRAGRVMKPTRGTRWRRHAALSRGAAW